MKTQKTQKMPSIYIAYGSNLNIRQMKQRCPLAKIHRFRETELQDYQLLFRGGNGNAVATIEPKKGCSVPVGLWTITPTDEIALDRYEGWPRLYRKEVFTVTIGKRKMRAFAYIMNEGVLGSPSRYYLNTIAQGYKDFGFNLDVLAQAVRDSVNR